MWVLEVFEFFREESSSRGFKGVLFESLLLKNLQKKTFETPGLR